MLQYDFDQSIGCWVAMTSHALRRALDAELARENITLRQWEVLAWIALEGEQSQVELAERLGIEAPTLAGVLSRMERDGWLERYGCPQDRRRKRIRATAKAESVWNRMVECCRRVRAQAIEGISEDELKQFRRICEQIRQNLGNSPEDRSANHQTTDRNTQLIEACLEQGDLKAAADTRGNGRAKQTKRKSRV